MKVRFRDGVCTFGYFQYPSVFFCQARRVLSLSEMDILNFGVMTSGVSSPPPSPACSRRLPFTKTHHRASPTWIPPTIKHCALVLQGRLSISPDRKPVDSKVSYFRPSLQKRIRPVYHLEAPREALNLTPRRNREMRLGGFASPSCAASGIISG